MRLRLTAAALLAVLTLLTACGSSDDDDSSDVASLQDASNTETTRSGNGDDEGEKDPQEAALEFAKCMREHGIDMPDPDTSGGGDVIFKAAPAAAAGKRLEGTPEQFQAADKECRPLLGDAAPARLSPEQQQEMQDQALTFSRCMREHGVNMPDPQFGGEGRVMLKVGPGDGLDPEDPKFQEAQQACGSAFGPPGAKAGAGLSVGGGKAGGAAGGKGGAIFFGGAPAQSSGGGK